MAHDIVKILTADDGEKRDGQVWCLVQIRTGDPCTLCTGEFFGLGQSGCKFKAKTVDKGGITCPDCLSIIKELKALKL